MAYLLRCLFFSFVLCHSSLGGILDSYFCKLKLTRKYSSSSANIDLTNEFKQDHLHFRTLKESQNTKLFQAYKESVISMIKKVFQPFLKGQINLSYEELIKAQHLHIQQNGYRGYYQGFHENLERVEIISSQFLFEQTGQRTIKLPLFKKYNISTPNEIFDYHLESMAKAHNEVKMDNIPSSASPKNYPMESWEKIHFKNTYQIPEKKLAALYYHNYPSQEHVKQYYLPQMKILFSKLTSSYKKMSDYDFLITLSDYYQVAINSHIFSKINNTVFASHLNTFLILKGYKGIPHSYLDYWAMSYSQKDFRKIFIDNVINQQ